MNLKWHKWNSLHDLDPKSFICGFCGNKVASHKGYFFNDHVEGRDVRAKIYICNNCGYPSFFDNEGTQWPGPMLGREIEKLPEDIKIVYFEIRESVKNHCFTSAILLGRKLIMHIAVDVAGAKEKDTFVNYIEHLKKSNFIPPKADKWLEYMKKLGNEKNHEIKIGKQEEAEKILKFIELLLIFMYEFPSEFEEEKPEQAQE